MSLEKGRSSGSRDSEGRSGCFGTLLGCLVIVVSLGAVLVGLIVIPFLRESGWSCQSVSARVQTRVTEYRSKVGEWIDALRGRTQGVRAKAESVGSEAREWSGNAAESVGETAGKVERKLTEPAVLPGAEKTTLDPVLVED